MIVSGRCRLYLCHGEPMRANNPGIRNRRCRSRPHRSVRSRTERTNLMNPDSFLAQPIRDLRLGFLRTKGYLRIRSQPLHVHPTAETRPSSPEPSRATATSSAVAHQPANTRVAAPELLHLNGVRLHDLQRMENAMG
jgi:hypothetical protein